ncbi:MAG: sterol desaturase family protein [Planctomycetales bacterium]
MPAAHETTVRVACFAGVLLAMALAELLAPRRKLALRRPWRWSSNLALVAINAALTRIVMPVTAVGAAAFADARGWGLLHLVELPESLEILLAVIVLDLVIYLQHVMFHAVPALWRLHMVHHADLDFDVTTGLRFHTLEIFLSALIKLAAVLALGPPALAVLAFEVLLNATSMFNHGNVRLPQRLDRLLRLIVVTPDMHRVHHSAVSRETNSNFGFNLPWWDFLLGTYRAQPRAGHEGMTIGLTSPRDEREVDRLPGMWLLPFRRPSGDGSLMAGPSSADSSPHYAPVPPQTDSGGSTCVTAMRPEKQTSTSVPSARGRSR